MPDLVTAVMIEVPASSYSALKFEVRTRNSCTASCEKGLPAAHVLPDDAALLDVALEADAVDEDVDLGAAEALAVRDPRRRRRRRMSGATRPTDSLMPGASAAKLRKLRLPCGRFSICSRRDVGRDLGRPGLDEAPPRDDDGVAGRRRRGCARLGRTRRRCSQVHIEARALADADYDLLRNGCTARAGERHVVASGA